MRGDAAARGQRRAALAVAPAIPDKGRMRLGALILAGGRSARMGRAKESLPFGASTLLGTVCAALTDCAAPIVVVRRDAGQPLPSLPSGVAVLHDAMPGRGPLGGIATGLRWLAGPGGLAADDAVFVTACDHPFLDAAAVRWLAARLGADDAVVPRLGDQVEPLCAIYRVAVLPAVDALLAAGDAGPQQLATAVAARVVDEAELRTFDPALAFLRDVDTPADYDAARRQRP